jgi:hypothetical protein
MTPAEKNRDSCGALYNRRGFNIKGNSPQAKVSWFYARIRRIEKKKEGKRDMTGS